MFSNIHKLKKMDEMERDIALKSMRWSYGFIILVLGIWILYEIFTNGKWQLPFYILIGQNLISFAATQLYRRKMDDEAWKSSMLMFAAAIVVLLLAALILPLFLIGR